MIIYHHNSPAHSLRPHSNPSTCVEGAAHRIRPAAAHTDPPVHRSLGLAEVVRTAADRAEERRIVEARLHIGLEERLEERRIAAVAVRRIAAVGRILAARRTAVAGRSHQLEGRVASGRRSCASSRPWCRSLDQ